MKVVYWIGGIALVGMLGLMQWLNSANAAVNIPATETKTLTGSQKTSLVNALKCAYPSLVTSTVHSGICRVSRTPEHQDAGGETIPASEVWTCALWAAGVSMTADEFVEARETGDVGDYDKGSWNGSTLTARKRIAVVPFTGACYVMLDSWIGSVFSGATLALTKGFDAARQVASPSTIVVTRRGFRTATAAEWINAGGGQPDGPEPTGAAD